MRREGGGLGKRESSGGEREGAGARCAQSPALAGGNAGGSTATIALRTTLRHSRPRDSARNPRWAAGLRGKRCGKSVACIWNTMIIRIPEYHWLRTHSTSCAL